MKQTIELTSLEAAKAKPLLSPALYAALRALLRGLSTHRAEPGVALAVTLELAEAAMQGTVHLVCRVEPGASDAIPPEVAEEGLEDIPAPLRRSIAPFAALLDTVPSDLAALIRCRAAYLAEGEIQTEEILFNHPATVRLGKRELVLDLAAEADDSEVSGEGHCTCGGHGR